MLNTMDPRIAIARNPMSRLQIGIVALCIALNAMDGFDVLAISFAAPGIAEEWQIDRAVLGVVLSMELIGMAIGSVLIGNLADRIGRRPTILTCLGVMSAGMFLAAIANSVVTLSVIRLLTGLGIGGMLSSTSAMVAEYSNAKRHNLNTILNIAGYALGSIVGGIFASMLLARTGDWRAVFIFGGAMSALLLPVAWYYLPESIHWQMVRKRAGVVASLNRTIVRIGLEPIDSLPQQSTEPHRPSILALFKKRYAYTTGALTIAYFTLIMAFYFIMKWTPKIVVDLGHDQASAGSVLVFASVGSLCGAVTLGLTASRIRLRPTVVVAMVVAFVFFGFFGMGHTDLVRLSLFSALAIFFTNAAVVGMYPIMAKCYPAELRASGIGFAIGVGRGGSALGPLIAGLLFKGGSSLLTVSLIMGAGTLVAALMISILPKAAGQEEHGM